MCADLALLIVWLQIHPKITIYLYKAPLSYCPVTYKHLRRCYPFLLISFAGNSQVSLEMLSPFSCKRLVSCFCTT